MLLTYQKTVKLKTIHLLCLLETVRCLAITARVSCNNLLLPHPHQICVLRSSYMLLPSFITNRISYCRSAFLFLLFPIDTGCGRGETGPYATMMGSDTFMVLNGRLNAR